MCRNCTAEDYKDWSPVAPGEGKASRSVCPPLSEARCLQVCAGQEGGVQEEESQGKVLQWAGVHSEREQ